MSKKGNLSSNCLLRELFRQIVSQGNYFDEVSFKGNISTRHFLQRTHFEFDIGCKIEADSV